MVGCSSSGLKLVSALMLVIGLINAVLSILFLFLDKIIATDGLWVCGYKTKTKARNHPNGLKYQARTHKSRKPTDEYAYFKCHITRELIKNRSSGNGTENYWNAEWVKTYVETPLQFHNGSIGAIMDARNKQLYLHSYAKENPL